VVLDLIVARAALIMTPVSAYRMTASIQLVAFRRADFPRFSSASFLAA
jgi:hypothetical protein